MVLESRLLPRSFRSNHCPRLVGSEKIKMPALIGLALIRYRYSTAITRQLVLTTFSLARIMHHLPKESAVLSNHVRLRVPFPSQKLPWECDGTQVCK